MKTPLRMIFFLFLIFFLPKLQSKAEEKGAEAEQRKRVLWISSYSSDDVGTETTIRSFRAKLSEHDIWANYESFDLAISYQLMADVSPADVEALRIKLKMTPYDLIVVLDTVATRLFLDGTLKPEGDTPVLSIGYLSPQPLQKKIPASLNMTGVQTSVNFWDTVRLARHLRPELKKIVLVVEAQPGGYKPPPAMENVPKDMGLDILVWSGNMLSTEDLFRRIGTLSPADSAIFFQSWSSTKENKAEHSYTVLPRIRKNFPGIIFGKYDAYIPAGSMGGIVPSSREIGEFAGDLACRILRGETARSIPVQWTKARTILDYPSLKAQGIPLSLLPADAILLNEPPEFIIEYRFELIAASVSLFFFLLLVLGGLFFRRQAQCKVEAMFAHLPLRVAVFARNGDVIYTHVPGAKHLNVRTLRELPAGLREWVLTSVAEVFAGKGSIEHTLQEGASWRNVRLSLLPTPNPFRQDVVMCVSGDITDLHKANLAVGEIAERFRLTLNSIGDGVIATDLEERITLINPVAAALTGYTPEEAIGKKLSEIFVIVSYLDGKIVPSPLEKALRTGEIVELANHTDLIARDGIRRHIADSAAPIRGADGRISGGVLVFRDVTEEYRQRDQARVHAQLLGSAIEIARMTYFRADRSGRFIYASAPGFAEEMNGIETRMSPDEAHLFRRKTNQLLACEVAETHQTYSVLQKDGGKKYYEIHVLRLDNELSGDYEFCGIVQDITEARENEMRYRDNLELIETVIDNLPGFYFVKDVEDHFRYILNNRTHDEVIGLPNTEIIGRTDAELFAMDAEAERKIVEEDLALVESGAVLDTQDAFLNHQKKQYFVRTIKKVISRSDGRRLMIGMGVDVSREHELEEEQLRTIETLNRYVESERVTNQLLVKITLEEDFHFAVNEMLRIIGESLQADRCYVFEYDGDDLGFSSNTFEWVAEGIRPVKDSLQNVDMRDFRGWRGTLLERRPILIQDMDHPPECFDVAVEIEGLRVQDIRSLLVSGVWIGGKLRGFVGIDFVRGNREFSACDTHTINSAANLFQLAYERARQREELLESVSMQRQIMDNIYLPITIIGLDYTILAANPSAFRDAEATPENFIGTRCYDTFCRFGEPPEFCPVRETLVTEKPCRKEHDFKTQRQISTAQPIFDRNGKMQYILTADIDITELTRQKKELQIAMEQAQAADRAKSYFLATVSHELRTPLNAVIGFSELLQHGGVAPDTQDEYLRSINFAGTALLNLVNDVLDLSKLEADQMTIAPTRNDLADLIRQVASVFKLKALEKNLDLHVDVSGIRHLLYVDNLRLRQILLNLLGNAVKFTSEGFVRVRGTFEPEPGTGHGTLCIEVSDSGIGISPESRKNIFDPFIQDNVTRGKRVYEGSGLGLSITKRLLEKMGGEISLESEPGKGSTFLVRIDKIAFEAPALTEDAPLPVPTLRRERKKVLLVDDVPINLKVLAAMLRRLEIESVTAASGEEALELLRQDAGFDAILTDMWMPEMSGYDLAVQIRKQAQFDEIPIAAVTADTQIPAEEKALFAYILHKPITIDSLEDLFKVIKQE